MANGTLSLLYILLNEKNQFQDPGMPISYIMDTWTRWFLAQNYLTTQVLTPQTKFLKYY